jgi:phosphoribosyl 1,2-cyclic phosphodiesterase
MFFSVLGSGSRGNSVYVESNGTAILIDAGFSGKELQYRLASINRSLSDVAAICITHEHNDHISGAGVVARRCNIPVYANIGTYCVAEKKLGRLPELIEFETGTAFEIQGLHVRSFRVSHDSQDPVGFVISDGRVTLGYCTDTGHVTHLMTTRLAGCNGLILEFNHNLDLLRNGPYPLSLQQRVRSRKGHLSNEDAASFLSILHNEYMQIVVLAHLSQQNNNPRLAEKAAKSAVREWGETILKVAGQDATSGLIHLR